MLLQFLAVSRAPLVDNTSRRTTSVPAEVQFQQAVTFFQRGQWNEARLACKNLLKQDARHADALHLLGVLAYQAGQYDDARRFLIKAIAVNPSDANFHSNLGNVFQQLAQYENAVASYDRAIVLHPGLAAVHYNRANALLALKRYDDAIAGYTRTILLKPDFAGAYYNRGLAFHESGRRAEAIADYDRVIVLSPEDGQAHYNRANALQDMGACADAVAAYDRAIALDRNFAPAHFNRGNALMKLGRYRDAAESYRNVLRMDPGHTEAHKSLLWAAIVMDVPAADLDALILETCAATAASEARALEVRKTVPAFRVQHDIEQGEYLLAWDAAYDGLRAAQEVLRKVRVRKPVRDSYRLASSEIETINQSRQRIVRQSGDGPCGEGLNPSNEWRALEDRYFSSNPEIVVIDDFLTPSALAQLQQFCLASMVWRSEYDNHYLGAFVNQGFVSPLLLQIARELRVKMPRIFGDHAFEQLWAFKYDSTIRRGINVHADFARINLNFWITPDDANLDPQSGGMVIYDAAAPTSWNFHEYNRDPERIYQFLAERKAGKKTVPYRCNRAVLFNSNLFHETDAIHFKDGYENRRINITYLFGRGLSE